MPPATEEEKRRRLEARLLKTLWRGEAHRRLAESNIIGVVFADLKGRITSANDAFLKMLGYTEQDIANGLLRWDSITPPEYRALDEKQIAEIELKGVAAPWTKEYIAKDGHRVPVLVGLALLEGSDNQSIGFVVDLTEQRRAEATARKYAEELRKKNATLEEDLKMAREVQLAFLPQEYPRFFSPREPEVPALSFVHRYIPAGEVGGDLFDVLDLSLTRALIIVCDVMGHGVRAALITAMVRAFVEQMRGSVQDPGSMLTQLNKMLISTLRESGTPTFVTACVAIADLVEDTLSYANAGHPAPFLLQRTEGMVEMLKAQRVEPPMGLVETSLYPTHQTKFLRGDAVLLYTDGLSEFEQREGEPAFTNETLLELTRKLVHEKIDAACDGLIASARVSARDGQFLDDVCIVGMERTA